MTAYACLLFAVNVGGRAVPSVQLRALAGELGFADPRTVANSGTLVVRPGTTGALSEAQVAALIEAGVADRFGVDAAVAVLTGQRLAEAVAANPFPEAASDHPARFQLLVGATALDPNGLAALIASHPGTERLAVAAGHLYIDYPDGIGVSKLTSRTLAKAAGTAVTGRNWNTARTLAELTASPPGVLTVPGLH